LASMDCYDFFVLFHAYDTLFSVIGSIISCVFGSDLFMRSEHGITYSYKMEGCLISRVTYQSIKGLAVRGRNRRQEYT
jgi:hypothetical protein